MITAQAIPLIGSLVIARIFIPADFGIYSIWLGYVSIVSVIITGRLEHALGLEEAGLTRKKLFVSVLILTVSVSIILFLLLIGYMLTGLPLLSIPKSMILLLIPTGLLLALSQLWQSLTACDGKFKKLSLIRIIQASTVTLLQIASGLLNPSAISLAASHAFGALLGVIAAVIIVRIQKEAYPDSATEILFSIKQMLNRHRKFPQYSLPADGLNTIAGYLPLFFLASRFGSEVTGWTALAMRIFGAPIALLGGAVRDVFKNSASEAFLIRGECRSEYTHTFKVLFICSALAVPVFMLISEEFFSIAFGENWRQAGVICAWLAPMFAMRFISSPLSYTIYIAEKQNYDLLWQASLLFMTLSSFIFPSNYKSALIIYSLGYSFLYLIYCLMSYHFSKGNNYDCNR